MPERVYLPYYMVRVEDGGRFYGEAHLSLVAERYRILVLATPRDPGLERVPLGGKRADPLAAPGEYARILGERLSEMEEASRRTGFQVGGLKGLLRIIARGLAGRGSTGLRGSPSLEARLALAYAREALGLYPGARIIAESEAYWLPVDVEVGERGVAAWVRGERFRVLERLAAEDPGVLGALKKLAGNP